jgi:RNA 2',3'-cyclic 3'-phosphodiesterase
MQPGETGRLFIAIPLPEAVKAEVEKAQMELRRAVPDPCVRWTRRDQFHLTLKFLGDVAAERLDALMDTLDRVRRKFSPLHLRAGSVGFFPNHRLPRVIWVGVRDPRDELPALQNAVETAVADFTRERPEGRFSGHVTLGRVKGISRAQAELLAQRALSLADRSLGEWTANEVELIRSELGRDGARYSTLTAFPLAGGGKPETGS